MGKAVGAHEPADEELAHELQAEGDVDIGIALVPARPGGTLAKRGCSQRECHGEVLTGKCSWAEARAQRIHLPLRVRLLGPEAADDPHVGPAEVDADVDEDEVADQRVEHERAARRVPAESRVGSLNRGATVH